MTHTFEIMLADLNLSGEIDFNGSGEPRISTDNPLNLSLQKYKGIGILLSECFELHQDYGEITKIEIIKK